MDKLLLRGGHPLRGKVQISGAKNAALPLLFATLLAPGRHRLRSVPKLRDIDTTVNLLTMLGARVEQDGDQVTVDSTHLNCHEAPYELVRTMRASVLVLGPVLARLGRARVSLPGGCAIGARPIDLHLKGLAALGAEIRLDHGYVEARAEKLRGANIYFDFPTVGGTENLMMAGVLARGTTVLENAACEPEIGDLAAALNRMGGRISGAGTDTITIEGVASLEPMDHQVMPDRIEAGTFLVAATMTGGDVLVDRAVPEHLEAVINKLGSCGAKFETRAEGLRVIGPERVRAVDIRTQPYPGFPTDMQAQFMALAALAEGTSIISETVFENRFMHVAELQRLGANISIDGRTATVKGVPRLVGAPVMATDLRASACLVLAGMAAENTTEIRRIYHLDRGYEQLEVKLAALGADIRRTRE